MFSTMKGEGCLWQEKGERQGAARETAAGQTGGTRTGCLSGFSREKKICSSFTMRLMIPIIRTARNLYRKGYSPQEAADILEEDEKTVAAWYKKWSKM